MKNVHKTLTALMVSAGLVLSPVAVQATGILTFDGAAAANALQSLLSMKQQIENQVKQLTQLKSQVTAMTGSRNMGNLLKDTVKDQIPTEWSSIYSKVKNVDYKSVMDGKNYSPATALNLLASNHAFSEQAFKSMDEQLNTIKQLQNAINSAGDIKAATDLQNRIAAEQAKIHNTQVKLDMMDRLYAQQEKIEQVKYTQREACMGRHVSDGKFDECNQ